MGAYVVEILKDEGIVAVAVFANEVEANIWAEIMYGDIIKHWVNFYEWGELFTSAEGY